jgi:hypothetical protein
MAASTHKITKEDLAPIFGGMTDRVVKKIAEFDLQYTILSEAERDECIRQIIESLLGEKLEVVGSHRHERWEKGWSENLDLLKKGGKDALIPRYFEKDQIARWKQQFIKPTKPGFDYGALTIILEWLFEKYMSDAKTIYEFGCGTGHHLPQLQDINPKAKLFGLDWVESSQKIIAEMVAKGILHNAEGRKFDFFNPDGSLVLEPESIVYTVAALEQVGERHTAFVDYLLKNKPALCVHVEPIAEVLDPANLPDYLSIEYFRRRNYLWGFLTRLRQLEKEKKIKIHAAQRTYLGGNMYVDHYSVIVWEPL